MSDAVQRGFRAHAAADRRSWWDHGVFLLALGVAGLAGLAAWGAVVALGASDVVEAALAGVVLFLLLVAAVHWIRRDHTAWVVGALLLAPGVPAGGALALHLAG